MNNLNNTTRLTIEKLNIIVWNISISMEMTQISSQFGWTTESTQ